VQQCLHISRIGFGLDSARAKKVSSGMIDSAVLELSRSVNIQDDPNARLLPEVSLQEVSKILLLW